MSQLEGYNAVAAFSSRGWRFLTLKWALLRFFIQAYVVFCFGTVIGGLISSPLITYLFWGDHRFWRYVHLAPKLFPFLIRSLHLIIRGGTGGFLFSVPLTTHPATGPDLDRVQLNPAWPYTNSCGPCTHCCDMIKCPLVDHTRSCCMGYNSLFWRYFNYGRFPTTKKQLDYYGCQKWLIG